jgi:hypothetical protein
MIAIVNITGKVNSYRGECHQQTIVAMVNIANKLLIIILSKNQELPIVMITSITLMILLFTATKGQYWCRSKIEINK